MANKGLLNLNSYGVTSVEFGSTGGSMYEESPFNGSGFARLLVKHRYNVQFEFRKLDTDSYRELMGFLNSLNGRFHTFEVIIPTESVPRGTYGSLLAAAGSSGNTLNVTGYSGSTVKVGDKFTIAGTDTKVYEIASYSTGVITTTHALRSTPSVGAALTFSNVRFTMRLDDDGISSMVDPTLLYSVSFSASEAF